MLPNPLNQFPRIAAIRPDEPYLGEADGQLVYDRFSPVPVLNVRRMHHYTQEQTHSIHNYVPLSSFNLLAGIIAAGPPFSVVFTDWLSIMAAVGVGLLPSPSRTSGRKLSCTRSQVPSSDQRRKYLYAVCQGGKSCGIIRQEQPLRSTYRMALSISRRSTLRGLPPGLASGSSGDRSSHCSSVRSLGYSLRVIHKCYHMSYALETPS